MKGDVFVIGAGKAANEMASVIEDMLYPKIKTGKVICNKKTQSLKKIEVMEGGHPRPTKEGILAAENILQLSKRVKKEDTVICLISGGGSSLFTNPIDGISFRDLIKLTDELLYSGASIHEINVIRKHVSKVKGGQLAKHFNCEIISLIISDVFDNDLSVIASGITYPDNSTIADCYNIIQKYNMEMPQNILDYLKKGIETPKELSNVSNYIIGNNKMAIDSMAKYSNGTIVTEKMQGEARQIALKNQKFLSKKGTFLFGGETTVTIERDKLQGKGGRNQEYILATLLKNNFKGEWVVAAMGSDGADYMEGVGGAIIDNHSKKDNLQSHLTNHDSYTALKKINSIIETNNTGTNVGDFVMYHFP